MNKNLILVFYALLCTISCKNHASEEVSVFRVVMKVQSENKSNISFQMYFMEEGDDNFTKDKVVDGSVISSSDEVEFKLPKNSFPTNLRFDFGDEKVVERFTFVAMSMTYKDLKIDMSLVEFNAFFRPNEYIDFDKNSGEIRCRMIKGKYDPYFISRSLFNKRLEIEKR